MRRVSKVVNTEFTFPFFSLEELNGAIRELLTKLNHRSFRKREGSRASAFEAIDKPRIETAARTLRSERVVARRVSLDGAGPSLAT